MIPKLTLERLREVLRYEPENGAFFWLKDCNQKRRAGDKAGNADNKGYWCIMIDGKTYKGHRLAWLWMTESWPEREVDHINLDKSDNRWENLRAASHARNCANTPRKVTNRVGAKGIRLTTSGKYVARIMKDQKPYHLGAFVTLKEAKEAYAAAAIIHFGEYARTE